MADRPTGIGDSPSLVLTSETYPVPGDRKGIVAVIERVLNMGGVQRMLLEYGKPLRVSRMVRKSDTPEVPQELVDDDLYAAARNAEMAEFTPKVIVGKKESPTAFETLFYAFDDLTRRRLKPKALLVHRYAELKEWLRVEANQDVSEVFGTDVRQHKEIPDDVALLLATTWDDLDTVVFSLRFGLDSPRRK